MAQPDTTTEIHDKVQQWKTAFAHKVSAVSGDQMPADVTALSYVDILTGGEQNPLAFDDAVDVFLDGLKTIGFFSDAASQRLHTSGRDVADEVAHHIATEFSDASFAATMQAGPMIAMPPGERLAIVLHDKPFRITEIFYETKDETMLQLPDVFVLDAYDTNFYTVKAVAKLDDNPVFKQRMDELGLR